MVHSILRTDGVTGLYRGLPGIWIKDVPGSFLYFGSYELAKSSIRRLKRNEILGQWNPQTCTSRELFFPELASEIQMAQRNPE